MDGERRRLGCGQRGLDGVLASALAQGERCRVDGVQGPPCSGERSGLGCRRRAASGALGLLTRARDAQRPRSTRGSSLGDWYRVSAPRRAAGAASPFSSLECCIAARPPAVQAIAKECVVTVISKAQQRTESREARLRRSSRLQAGRAAGDLPKFSGIKSRPHPSLSFRNMRPGPRGDCSPPHCVSKK